MYSSSKINIFKIHKESFIKQTSLIETFNTEKHKTSLMMRDIHSLCMIIKLKYISIISFFYHFLW